MARPVQLAGGVWRICTLSPNLVNSFVFEEPDGSVTLVDTGYKRSGPKGVVSGLVALGKQPSQVRRILLTHAHPDHAGGASRLVTRTQAPVQTHDEDARYAAAGRPPPYEGPSRLGRVLNAWPLRFGKIDVESTFHDGELLDVAGGLRVLHTPGHTPGHCSFLHERSGVLITGDSLFNFFDRMASSYAYLCNDPAMARDTADRLGDAEYEVAAFTHGPEIRERARDRIREFLRRRAR